MFKIIYKWLIVGVHATVVIQPTSQWREET